VTLNLAETSVAKSRPSVPHGANWFCVVYRSLVVFIVLTAPSRSLYLTDKAWTTGLLHSIFAYSDSKCDLRALFADIGLFAEQQFRRDLIKRFSSSER